MIEILSQKKSFQIYLIIYAICFTWICFFGVFKNIIQVNEWIAYYIPLITLVINTLIVSFFALQIVLLQKKGKIITCKIIHSATDFGNGTIHIRCIPDGVQSFYFEEDVRVPFLSIVPEVETIYKNAKRYSDIESIEVLVDPLNYSRYEVLYFKLLTDECRKSKYQIFVVSIIFIIVSIVVARVTPTHTM